MFERIRSLVAATFATATQLVGSAVSDLEQIKQGLHVLVPDLILAAETTGAENSAKRLMVLDGVGKWMDEQILPQDQAGPDWIVDPVLRAGAILYAGQLNDFGVVLLKRSGELKKAAA